VVKYGIRHKEDIKDYWGDSKEGMNCERQGEKKKRSEGGCEGCEAREECEGMKSIA
jgi:MoaA/NifB/PqqE/SkfB family radical SAM enzyme